jgi:hypothetical protein
MTSRPPEPLAIRRGIGSVMKASRMAMLLATTLALWACAGLLPSPERVAPSTTCAEFTAMAPDARANLVTAIIDAENLLEFVRSRQHEGPTTTRATLILEALASVQKNCEVMRKPRQSVSQLIMALYADDQSRAREPGLD